MNAVVKEWVAKAEGDFATARRESRVVRSANYDAVCFHAQQGAEKYLKAFLIHLGYPPPKVHDLAELQRALILVYPLWHWPVEDLRLLTMSAVAFRYPGESAERDEAKQALRIASGIRKLARQALGLAKPGRRAK